MPLSPKLQADLDLLLDTFGGGDNVGFLAYKMTLEDMAQKKDDASKQLVELTVKFAKFLRVCKTMHFPEID